VVTFPVEGAPDTASSEEAPVAAVPTVAAVTSKGEASQWRSDPECTS
jgi:hypothetical protein